MGPTLNFDGPQSEIVRRFFIENALHWIHEYHFDGLRLDATHAIVDESPAHFLAELTLTVERSMQKKRRRVLIIAEDDRNLACIATPRNSGGWGLDAAWADDLHHEIHRCLTGERDGYFADFSGTTADIATTVQQGWFYRGQHTSGEDNTDLRELLSIVFHLEHIPVFTEAGPEMVAERDREKSVASERLAALVAKAPEIQHYIEEVVRDFNGRRGVAESFDLLHQLLDLQPYRPRPLSICAAASDICSCSESMFPSQSRASAANMWLRSADKAEEMPSLRLSLA